MPKHKDLTSDESSEDSDYEPTKKKGKKSSPQKAEKSKAPPSGIGEVSFQLSANRWVSVSEFRKKVFVNIREYYDADGEMKPGRKGIALNMAQWKNLKSHMDEIDKTLEDYE